MIVACRFSTSMGSSFDAVVNLKYNCSMIVVLKCILKGSLLNNDSGAVLFSRFVREWVTVYDVM